MSSCYDILFYFCLVSSVLSVCERFYKQANHIRSDRDNKSNYDRQYVTELES